MSCTDCAKAAQVQHHGFTGGCRGCCARALARGPHFFRCQQAGTQDRQYRAALAQFELTHEDVLAANRADVMRREAKRP